MDTSHKGFQLGILPERKIDRRAVATGYGLIVLLTLIVGSLLGAVVGLGYIFFTGKDPSTYELPFGAFLGVAALAVAFWGEFMITWYGRLGA